MGVQRHTRWVKPTLTDKQRVDQVGFVLSHLHKRGGVGVLVEDMFDWIHVDEKWFYLMKDDENVYLQPDEVPKPPRASNKWFILKMFLAAIARHRKLSNRVWFDRKISIWSNVDMVMAQRASKSYAWGDPALRPVMVDGEKYKKTMIDEVIPAIKAQMPRLLGHIVLVQHDGDKWHSKRGVMEAIQAEAGNSIMLESQPSNSPDLHMNDFGFFHSIQQLKEYVGLTTADGLVEATLEAFDIYP
ncbi:unnamed protein product [Discosporangium mesarthrocarpum]